MITERGSTTLLLLGYYISVKKNVQTTTIFKMLISPEFTPVFCWVRVAHLFFCCCCCFCFVFCLFVFFCVVLLCVFTFWVPCCDVLCDFRKRKTMFGSSLPPVVCRRSHVLFTLFVFVCVRVVHHILCCCFLFYFSPSCVSYVASFSGLPFLVASSVFSNVYSNYHKIVFLK